MLSPRVCAACIKANWLHKRDRDDWERFARFHVTSHFCGVGGYAWERSPENGPSPLDPPESCEYKFEHLIAVGDVPE